MRKQVNFTESTAILANPFMGLQSCDEPARSSSWPSQIAYCKYYRHEMQPTRNTFNFSWFDEQMDACIARGQLFGFRVMECDEANSSPMWLKDLGCTGYSYLDRDDGGTERQWVADVADPIFVQENRIFLKALYEHIKARNKLKYLAFIDIGTVGLWGEWHFSGLNPSVPMPNEAAAQTIVNQWQLIFPNIQSFAQIVDPKSAAFAMSHGAGWRGDGFGDPNHNNRYYPAWLTQAAAGENWKKAPVSFESYGDVAYWVSKKWDVASIVNFALAQHATYINLKNWGHIPDIAKPEITRLLKGVGYRIFVSGIGYDESIKRGDNFVAQITIGNSGVAPTYKPLSLSLKVGATRIATTEFVIKPGETKQVLLQFVNSGTLALRAARYDLSLSASMAGFPVQFASNASYTGKDLKFGTLTVS